MWSTRIQQSVSGAEVRIQDQTFPRYQWDLVYDLLRQGVIHVGDAAWTEHQQLFGFYNLMGGSAQSFLYESDEDHQVTGQLLGTGDGSTKTFQLITSYGGFAQPCYAPHVVSHVYVNGVDSGGWSVANWGSTTPGLVTLASAPAAGQSVTADFTYYYPVRFVDDQCKFSKFAKGMYEVKQLSFISIKLGA